MDFRHKLDSLSKLVNSYSRLIERDKQKEIDPMDGDPTYCKKIAADRTDRKGSSGRHSAIYLRRKIHSTRLGPDHKFFPSRPMESDPRNSLPKEQD